MSNVGQKERKTQNRVVQFFKEQFNYQTKQGMIKVLLTCSTRLSLNKG
ncbi:hypothetical protein GARC_3340 [Paraglaciecola arctica BSs20135]|uniref:Uncharacterized protein n=1 Tax=Paraglaciecola arctica BSs20135 TaxID=493475 RepID=K6YUD7_9ALTE|nr:hypothetical protein GARC_3340 [Paraglaciecola arctica BSs20135]